MKNDIIILSFIFGALLLSCNNYKEIIKGSYSISQKKNISKKNCLLTGKVLSKEKGNPIKDATISIVDSKIGSFTDADGGFQIEVSPGIYKVGAKFTGYDDLSTKEVEIKEGEHIHIIIHLGTTNIYQKE